MHTAMALHWKILIGMLLGFMLGVCARVFGFEPFVTERIALIGTLFLRALTMVVIPLIASSLIVSVSSIAAHRDFGVLSLKTGLYYLCSSMLAILTGLALVNLIKPGRGADLGLRQVPEALGEVGTGLKETLMRIVPSNPIEALAQGDMLAIIFFALFFGVFLSRAPNPHREQLRGFFQSVFTVMMLCTRFIITLAPLGVFALVADVTAAAGPGVFIELARYLLTVGLGLTIHMTVTLPLVLIVAARINPLRHARAVSGALLTAFSTASSAATLPLTMSLVREQDGVSDEVSGFVLPLGATVNMDGTALYECVAVLFIAQAYGIDLSAGQQVLVVVTALLASIGAAAVPMAGLVMMVIILNAVGLPLEGIGLILAVDRILDMLRTSTNVWSDTCGAVVIARIRGETLRL